MTVKRFQQKVKQLMKNRGWKKYRLAEDLKEIVFQSLKQLKRSVLPLI